MGVISIDCPYCGSQKTSFHLANALQPLPERDLERRPARGEVTHQAIGACGGCGKYVVFFFSVTGSQISRRDTFDTSANLDFVEPVAVSGITARFIAHAPKSPKPQIPDHLPENVNRSYLEAEKALLAGLFPSAAMNYGKAIERSLSGRVEEKFVNLPLGAKLAHLKKKEEFPKPMLDWIDAVKDDRIFATHDDDRDFASREEVEPMRMFAHTFLTYLFTLPKEVEDAMAKTRERKEG